MRIAMVSEPAEAHAGQVADLATALAALGHDVTVHCRRDGRAAGEEVTTERGYRVERAPAGPARVLPEDEVVTLAPRFAEALDVAWMRERPDVVHTLSWAMAPAALAAASKHRIPLVHAVRSGGPHTGRRAEVEHVLTRAADRISAACGGHADALVTAGVPRSRISVVPDGVDVDLFTPDGTRAPVGQRHRLVALGDPAPHSGFSTAIAALRGLSDTELVLPCPPVAALRRYAGELGVAARVHFAGAVPRAELPALLRSADIVVCTPWHEPVHGAVLEAMACGAPVVATAVGPLADLVVDKVTGLLVPPRRPRVLADVLHRLLNQRTTREQYGATASDRAAARYPWPRIAVETLHVYERAGVVLAATPQVASSRQGHPIGAWH